MVAAWIAVLGVGAAHAADVTAMTRAQWLKKIGVSVTQETVLRDTLTHVSPDDRVEFTQRLLKAVTRLPVNPDEKAAAFVRAAVSCIAGTKGDVKYKVIAEVFADVPVEFLPIVTEELAKRFNQEYNNLSDEQYEVIASAAVKAAVIRNAQTDEPSVRNTFVVLAFLRGAKHSKKLQEDLLALLPDDRMRGLAASWLAPALNDRNYDGLLAAADVDAIALSHDSILRLVGHTNLDRLLSDMGTGQSLSSVIGANIDALPPGGPYLPTDIGINRLPLPYQDQSVSILPTDSSGYCDACSICNQKFIR